MARTAAGRTLTEEHRQAQLRLRAAALRDFLQLWPLWEGDEDTFNRLIVATLPLISTYYRLSSSLAASYFESFRRAERVAGEAVPRLAPPMDRDRVVAGLFSTGRDEVGRALRRGKPADEAMRLALVRMSGSVTRQVLAGGRETLIRSVEDDRQALGWARVTDGDPCAFCALLASRGPVYKTRRTGGFEAHDDCGCGVMPFYQGAEWPGRAREYGALYDRAIRDAREAGELDRGTSNDLLNAFRRAYDAQRAT